MVVLTTRYNHIHGSAAGKNEEIKRDEGVVVCRWMTNREVMIKSTSVINIKNGQSKRVTSQKKHNY
jgi:hypothetical protein